MTAVLRLIALIFWSLLAAPIQYVAMHVGLKASKRIPMLFHQGALWILGIAVETEGEMRSTGPTLFVANHISYLDIFVMGAMIEGSFVAKAEVRSWPVIGFFAKLQRTIFVERRRRAAVGAQRDMLQRRFEEGVNIILFPEGTSFDGARVLPFKSALFATAEREVDGRHVTVQPVSLAYVTMDGLPITRAQRPTIAWYGDMGMLPHLWKFLRASRTRVVLRFHRPCVIDQYGDRRKLAAACRDVVAHGVTALVSGREPAPRPDLPPPTPDGPSSGSGHDPSGGVPAAAGAT